MTDKPTEPRESTYQAPEDGIYLHPLTPEEAFEVKAAMDAVIAALPEGDDDRGLARAALVSARKKLDLHWCAWCPREVRDLSAVSHNAANAYGTGRESKKMFSLRRAVAAYRPALDAHFEALGRFRHGG